MYLAQIIEMLNGIVRLARTGCSAEAASLVNRSVAKIQQALQSSPPAPGVLRELVYSLETLLLMQQQQDWVGLADVVEYELVEQVTSWSRGVAQDRPS